jgi:Flp pilus assembly pilin Flp
MRIPWEHVKADESAVTAVEYGMIACLVALVVCAVAAAVTGGSLENTFYVLANTI